MTSPVNGSFADALKIHQELQKKRLAGNLSKWDLGQAKTNPLLQKEWDNDLIDDDLCEFPLTEKMLNDLLSKGWTLIQKQGPTESPPPGW